MAQCDDLFQKFHESILLDRTSEDRLRKGRDALRQKIVSYFSDEGSEGLPTFTSQGSFKLRTLVRPLPGDEFDIDDGIYLHNLDSAKPKTPTAETVHGWILDAVDEHTETPPVDKATCILVIYAGDYHVDFPIYCEWGGVTYLAVKGGWQPSDARAYTAWFLARLKEKGEQLRRTLRYLKAWSDRNSGAGKLPCGFVMTSLVVPLFQPKDGDDAAIGSVAASLYSLLQHGTSYPNPVDHGEDLRKDREEQFERLRNGMKRLSDSAQLALHEQSKKKACRIWRREFGERFPDCSQVEEPEATLSTTKPAKLGRDDARSAGWA